MSDCIGCLLPPDGIGAGAETSNGLNSPPFHESFWSISGVSSPIISTSNRSECATERPFFVSFQVLDIEFSNSNRPLLEETCATRSSSRFEESTGPSERELMNSDLLVISLEIALPSEKVKFPESIQTPSPLRIPIPGPVSLLSNFEDAKAFIVLSSKSRELTHSQRLDSSTPSR